MKVTFKLTMTALILSAVFLWAPNVRAQSDTLVIPWENGSGVIVDTLYNAIMGDTLADGTRKDLNRVYELQKGGEYWNDQTIKNQDSKGNAFTLRIVGQTPDPTNANGNPPTLQLLNTKGASHIMQGYGDVYFKNLYIIGADQTGNQSSYYQTIEFESPNTHCVFDSCIFERDNFGCVAWTTTGNDVTFKNCEFRNLVEFPMTQEWTGRGFSEWADEDSTIVENCTFFNVGAFAIQIEGGSPKYLRFNHNTLVDVGHSITSGGGGAWWWEAYFTNSLFINTFWQGEGYLEYSPTLNPSRDPRATFSGMLSVSPLPAVYGPSVGRRIGIANDAAYLDPYFKTQYSDTVRMQYFTNAVTDSFFNTYSPANGGQMVIEDTTWLANYPSFPPAVIDSLNALKSVQWQSVVDVRDAVAGPPSYFYDLQSDPTYPTWPLPENFSYSDASLMTGGTDGLPLGDLNWFPSDKAKWHNNKDAYVRTVTDVPGKQTVFKVDSIVEAEGGNLGGTSQADLVQGGLIYDYFNGVGDIKWTFNLPSQLTNATLRIYVNCNGNSQKGQNVIVNGAYLQQTGKYGQIMFDSPPLALNAWDSLDVTSADSTGGTAWSATLPAGTNTVEIGNSWGYDEFSGIAVLNSSGQVVEKLGIADANLKTITGQLGVQGAPWVPSGLHFVAMGTNGTDTLNVTAPEAGTYLLDVFDQILTSGATLQASVDGGSPMALTVSTIDTAGSEQLTGTFPLTAGNHKLVFTGSNINFDKVQLTQSVTAVKKQPGLPNTFVLDQNYPNPFNPTTQIEYSIPQRAMVTLTIYNVLGQRVTTLFSGYQAAGHYQVTFNADRFASGVYFYRLQAGSYSFTKKMMLLK